MRKKDVILDFTPLLDIILIILFFFILYSVFNVKESEERAEQARMAYEDKLDALDAEEARLGAEWERLRTLDENAARNQQALIAFDNGSMLSFNLQKEDDNDAWRLSATRKRSADGDEERVGVILPGEDLTKGILRIFAEAGYAEDEVLIVTFTYNGNVIGTHRLYREIMKAFRDVRTVRKNVYLTAINTSK